MISKVTVDNTRYTNILMGTVQGAIANGVLDSVRDGTIDKNKANDLGIIVSVWLNPSVSKMTLWITKYYLIYIEKLLIKR